MAACQKTGAVSALIAAYNEKAAECPCGDPASLFPDNTATMCGDDGRLGGLFLQVHEATQQMIQTCGLEEGVFAFPGEPECGYTIQDIRDYANYIRSLVCPEDPENPSPYTSCLATGSPNLYSEWTPGYEVPEEYVWFDGGAMFKPGNYRVNYVSGVVRGSLSKWSTNLSAWGDHFGTYLDADGLFNEGLYFRGLAIYLVHKTCDGTIQRFTRYESLLSEIDPDLYARFDTQAAAEAHVAGVAKVARITTEVSGQIGWAIGYCKTAGPDRGVGLGYAAEDLAPVGFKVEAYSEGGMTYAITACPNRCSPQPVQDASYEYIPGGSGSAARFKWTPPSGGCATGYRIYASKVTDCATGCTGEEDLDLISGEALITDCTADEYGLATAFPEGTYCARIDTIMEFEENGATVELTAEGAHFCFESTCNQEAPEIRAKPTQSDILPVDGLVLESADWADGVKLDIQAQIRNASWYEVQVFAPNGASILNSGAAFPFDEDWANFNWTRNILVGSTAYFYVQWRLFVRNDCGDSYMTPLRTISVRPIEPPEDPPVTADCISMAMASTVSVIKTYSGLQDIEIFVWNDFVDTDFSGYRTWKVASISGRVLASGVIGATGKMLGAAATYTEQITLPVGYNGDYVDINLTVCP